LAGLETGSAAKIGVSKSAEVSWQSMEPVPEFEGLFHFRLKLTPGPHLVSFAVPGMPPVTYATYALPNRAVLMVFDVKNSGRLDARQMLLPVYSLAQYLDWKVKDRLESEQLRLVKYLVLAQERFAKRDSLEPATPEEKDRWDTMLYGKWIDPLLAIMVILEAARRGRILEVAQNMQEAITNLNRFFGELPDVSAVSRLLGVDSSSSSGTPLLLESLQRAPQLKNTLPLPASYLDYNSMWTSWFGAVKPPRWKLWWRPG
jgi:hypothetical protein